MKANFLYVRIVVLLITSGIAINSVSQNTFNLLISTPWHEVLTHSGEDNDGNYYLTGWKTEIYSPETCGWIIKLNNNGEIIQELEFCIPDSSCVLNDFILENDTLFVFGSKGLATGGMDFLIKMTLDKNLSILQNKSERILPGYYLNSFNPIVNKKKHFVICGNAVPISNSQDRDIFFYEMTRNYDSIRCVLDQRVYIQTCVDFLEDTTNHKYKVIGYGTYENTTPGYDEIIDFDTLFNFLQVDSVPWHLKSQFTTKWLDENYYLIGGIKGLYNPVRADLGLIKLNKEDEIQSNNHFGMGGDTNNYPALNSLGITEEKHIYFGGTSNISNTFNPFPDEDSWLILNYLDTNLNLIWQEFYGGDAFYHMIGLQATSDGGCLMYAERYDENIQFEEYDVYILKVDSAGLLTSTGEGPKIPVQQLAIVPNPAWDIVSIRYPDIFGYDDKEIEVFNSLGTPLLKESAKQDLTETRIDVGRLPAGLYFVVLKVEGKKVATGKMVKI